MLEGSGRSEKIWLINPNTKQIGLFKYKKDQHTTDHISEYIAYKLACLLNIECAKYEVGTYYGREGGMSYNILTNDKQRLIEGVDYIYGKYPSYDVNKLMNISDGKVYSLEMIKESIQQIIEYKIFLVIPLFDYLIGNTDRHQNNWALIIENEKARLSPLYDNSSSLCAYMKENELLACLGNDTMKWKSIVETKSKSMIRRTLWDKQRPTHLEVIKYIKESYYNETKEMVHNMVSNITEKNIDKIIEIFSDKELSANKKKVIKKFLLSKVNKLEDVYFRRF